MTRSRACVFALSATLALWATSALAQPVSMRSLLAEGFEIKAAEAIGQDVLQRSVDASWRDGYLVTLQKGARIAMCHGLLQLTADANNFVDINCTVSSEAPPAQPTN